MKTYNLDKIVHYVLKAIEERRLAPGTYVRWHIQNSWGGRYMGINEYGCADAANILYTIGYFPSDPEERKCWVETLQNMQDPKTGRFTE